MAARNTVQPMPDDEEAGPEAGDVLAQHQDELKASIKDLVRASRSYSFRKYFPTVRQLLDPKSAVQAFILGSALGVATLVAGVVFLVVAPGKWFAWAPLLAYSVFAIVVAPSNTRVFFLGDMANRFEALSGRAREVLDEVNARVEAEKQGLFASGSGEAGIEAVRAIADVHPSDGLVMQELPGWWHGLVVVRAAWLVACSLLLVGPDALRTLMTMMNRAVEGRVVDMWMAHTASSSVFRLAVRPWLQRLIADLQQAAQAVSTDLDDALDAIARRVDGATFMKAGVKKQARAIVKVKDDYLFERLPWHFTLARFVHLFPRVQEWLVDFTPLGWRLYRKQRAALRESGAREGAHRRLRAKFATLLPLLVLVEVGALLLKGVGLIMNTGFALGLWFSLVVFHTFVAPVLYLRHAGPSTARLVDMARGMLVCDSAAAMLRVHQEITTNCGATWEVVRVKNGWADDTVVGYAHILYNVRMASNGTIAEVQVTHRKLFEWRKFTHLPYKVLRAEDALALVNDVAHQTQEELRLEVASYKSKVRSLERELDALRQDYESMRVALAQAQGQAQPQSQPLA